MYDHKRAAQKRIWFLVTVLFFHLILISSNIVLPNNRSLLHNLFLNLVTPFQKFFNNGINGFNSIVKKYLFLKGSHIKYLRATQEIQDLKLELSELRRKIQTSDILLKTKIDTNKFILADLVLIDINFPLSSVLINRGFEDEIHPNMTVINIEGDLVGKIIEPVTAHTSKVRLITSSIGGVGAYLESNKLEGFLTGTNKKICHFKYIIENKSVKIGDLLFTSGTDQIFPAYIPLGRVVQVRDDYLEKEVLVEPFFIKKSIKHLAILKDESKI